MSNSIATVGNEIAVAAAATPYAISVPKISRLLMVRTLYMIGPPSQPTRSYNVIKKPQLHCRGLKKYSIKLLTVKQFLCYNNTVKMCQNSIILQRILA